MPVKLKKKAKSKVKQAVVNVFDAVADIAAAKDKDFDLDMDSSTFFARKGQSGSRQKGVNP